MPVVDEPVRHLERQVVEHSNHISSVREAVASLEARMERRFEQVDRRFEQIDRRFEQVDQRFLSLETRLDNRFLGLEGRIDALDSKLSRHFLWLVGIVVTAMAAMLVTVATR